MLPTDDKARKALPIFRGPLMYFPDAIAEVARVCKIGNDQHNPGEPLHWNRGKSMEQLDTALRHMMDHGTGNTKDSDGAYHMAKAAWRCLAELQLTIERERAADVDAEPAPIVERESVYENVYRVFNYPALHPTFAELKATSIVPPAAVEPVAPSLQVHDEVMAYTKDRARQMAADFALADRRGEPNVHYTANPRQERDEKSRP